MKFYSEYDRRQHPQVSLIPQEIWESQLGREITDGQIKLMSLPIQELMSIIPRLRPNEAACFDEEGFPTVYEFKKTSNWLCIACRQPALTDSQLLDIANTIHLSERALFYCAARTGRINIVKNIIQANSIDQIRKMIMFLNCEVFYGAAANGHLDIMRELMELLPNDTLRMIRAWGYAAFERAAKYGQIDVVNELFKRAPDDVQEMIQHRGYEAFYHAGYNGHFSVMEKILSISSPAENRSMIKVRHHSAIGAALRHGSIDKVDMLLSYLTTDDILWMLKENSTRLYNQAAFGGIQALDKLMSIVPEGYSTGGGITPVFQENIFTGAIEGGRLEVIDWLLTRIPPTDVPTLITNARIKAFDYAKDNPNPMVMQRLLSFPEGFSYAEESFQFSHKYAAPFFNEKMRSLRLQRMSLEASHPGAVFDITDANEAKLCFYMMLNVIRRLRRGGNIDELLFLLAIPSVKALAHQPITPHRHNELLRYALDYDHIQAAKILIEIPEVRALASQSQLSRLESSDSPAQNIEGRSSMGLTRVNHEQRLGATLNSMQAINRRRPRVNISANDHEWPILWSNHTAEFINTFERNISQVEQLPPPNIRLGTTHSHVPASMPLPNINETQKNIIESTLNLMLFDYLEDIDPSTAIQVLNAVTASNLSETLSQSLISLNLYESVKQVRDILAHPCPQNRTESYPYFGAPEDSNRVVYKDQHEMPAFETRGLLSLTARNDDTATPITREATIEKVLALISEKMTHFNTLLTAAANRHGFFTTYQQPEDTSWMRFDLD